MRFPRQRPSSCTASQVDGRRLPRRSSSAPGSVTSPTSPAASARGPQPACPWTKRPAFAGRLRRGRHEEDPRRLPDRFRRSRSSGLASPAFYAYRWAQPMIDSTEQLPRQRARGGAAGRSHQQQVAVRAARERRADRQRRSSVSSPCRRACATSWATRWAEIETKSAQIREKTAGEPTRPDASPNSRACSPTSPASTSEARRAQVNALNIHKFSEGEYTWVRRRVYEAAGIELAGGIDMSKFEDLARDSAMKSNVDTTGHAEAGSARGEHRARQAAPCEDQGVGADGGSWALRPSTADSRDFASGQLAQGESGLAIRAGLGV